MPCVSGRARSVQTPLVRAGMLLRSQRDQEPAPACRALSARPALSPVRACSPASVAPQVLLLWLPLCVPHELSVVWSV